MKNHREIEKEITNKISNYIRERENTNKSTLDKRLGSLGIMALLKGDTSTAMQYLSNATIRDYLRAKEKGEFDE